MKETVIKAESLPHLLSLSVADLACAVLVGLVTHLNYLEVNNQNCFFGILLIEIII